jgi:hypothetical protein
MFAKRYKHLDQEIDMKIKTKVRGGPAVRGCGG